MKDIIENLNRKTLLIAGGILLLSVVLIIGIVILVSSPENEEKKPSDGEDTKIENTENTEADDSHIDITLTGDAELDPENNDMEKEEM